MRRRFLSFALAVVLAVLGTAGVAAYVRSADNRALAGLKTTTVLVAVKPIPAGTSAGAAMRAGWLGTQRLPLSSVPAGALTSLSTRLTGLVTSADIQPGQLLLQPMLVAQVSSGALPVPVGKIAVSIQLCLTEVVAGYVRAGSWVDVFDTSTRSGTLTGQAGCSGSQQQQPGARTFLVPSLSGIQVVAVGQAPPAQTGAQATQPGRSVATQPATNAPPNNSTVLVTFAADPAQAQELTLLNNTGVLSLGLVNPPQSSLAASPSSTKP